MNKPLQYCRQQLIPGSAFAVSLQFANPKLQDRLLVLHTLCTAIQAILLTVQEPAVGRAKLGWWGEQLLSPAASQHPAVKAMCELGMDADLTTSEWQPLLNGVLAQFEEERADSTEALLDWLNFAARPALHLEQKLVTGSITSKIPDLTLPAAMLELLRALPRLSEQGYWPIPLELQARHQLRRSDFQAGISRSSRFSIELSDCLIELLEPVEQHWRNNPPRKFDGNQNWRLRRSWIEARLCMRSLEQLKRNPDRFWAEAVSRPKLYDQWAAWRFARKLKKNNHGHADP